jgi:PQQ-dependent catabolism-associated CXXCW motif protein
MAKRSVSPKGLRGAVQPAPTVTPMLIPARPLGTARCLSVTHALAATRYLVAALTLAAIAIVAPPPKLVFAAGPATPPPANTSPATEPPGFWTGPINSAVPATLAGGKVIHDARRLRTLLKRPGTVVIDVSNAPRRPDNLATGAPWLPLPHQAIPGSLWIPGAGLGEIPPPVDDFFRKQLAATTGDDIARPIVIYCHRTCWLSWNAAKRAIGYGYRNVYWYRDGIEGWKAAHLPTAVIEPRVAPEG